MRKPTAAVTSVAFFAVAPGTVAGILPWQLTDGWTRNDVAEGLPLTIVGTVVSAGGIAALIGTFTLYVTQGRGTPAPLAPTDVLVVRGLNRYVRNPMYLAVVAVIVGQALILARPALLVYATVAFATMAAFTRWYEEPHLRARYGAQYDAYRARVPAWIPRRHTSPE